jgi:tetratricopeptide (TPR) repeat protein
MREGPVSQVRKDILNGWKEIGGYVCRDIRTVERWEKQRGLPVRRVPGAGRATVYALISELDEWLANTKPDGTELATDGRERDRSLEPVSLYSSAPPSHRAAEKPVIGSVAEQFSNFSPTEDNATLQGRSPSPVKLRRMPAGGGPAHPVTRHRMFIAAVTIAAGLICVLVWPLVRSHAKTAAGPALPHTPYTLDATAKNPEVPYRSQVPGVDDLYLRGIYRYEQRTPDSLRHSLNDFSAAIVKDPNYAPAYAGLANTYNLLREYSIMPDAEAYTKAKAADEHALALDPRLPQAHASLGFIDFFWSWDTVAAEREFRTALTLDPSSALAHHWYGSMLTHEGRYSEALEQLDIAQRLEPTSAAVLSTRALALGLSGHRGEAVDLLQDVLNESPAASSPHEILAILSKVQPRDPARLLDETRRVAELRHSGEMLQVTAAGETAYRSGGENAMWAAILAEEERLHPGASNRTYLMVQAEAALGRNEAAFKDLNLLLKRRDPGLIGIAMDPTLAPLHPDPRFVQMIASMGMPPLPQ